MVDRALARVRSKVLCLAEPGLRELRLVGLGAGVVGLGISAIAMTARIDAFQCCCGSGFLPIWREMAVVEFRTDSLFWGA